MRPSLLIAGLATLVSCGEPVRGVVFEDPLPAANITLARWGGGTFDLAAQKGKVVALYFGYTHCPDVCPTTMSDWARARRALGARADRMQWVFISVDPARDTPELAIGRRHPGLAEIAARRGRRGAPDRAVFARAAIRGPRPLAAVPLRAPS